MFMLTNTDIREREQLRKKKDAIKRLTNWSNRCLQVAMGYDFIDLPRIVGLVCTFA